LQVFPREGGNCRKTRQAVERLKPRLSVEGLGRRPPHFPPKLVDRGQDSGTARLSGRLRRRRVNNRGSALADEAIDLGGLCGVIAPFVPPVPPELPKESGRGNDLGIGFSHEDVDELLASDGTQARTPGRLPGLSADEGVEDKLGTIRQDPSTPTLSKLTQTTKALE
jgi:hypothetical protein